MKPVLKKTVEEEQQVLKEVQDVIQKQMTERLKDLGIMRQEIVDNRKFEFNEIPDQQQFLMNQHDQVREAYYTETYKRITDLSRMFYNPYFGMIDYVDHKLDDEECCYYIGKRGLSEEGQPIVLDWRTPAASLFYQQRLGEMIFKAPAGERSVDLEHRRQYIIKNVISGACSTLR